MKLSLHHIEKEYQHPVVRDISYTFEERKLYVIKGISEKSWKSVQNRVFVLHSATEMKLKRFTHFVINICFGRRREGKIR